MQVSPLRHGKGTHISLDEHPLRDTTTSVDIFRCEEPSANQTGVHRAVTKAIIHGFYSANEVEWIADMLNRSTSQVTLRFEYVDKDGNSTDGLRGTAHLENFKLSATVDDVVSYKITLTRVKIAPITQVTDNVDKFNKHIKDNYKPAPAQS